MVGDPEELIRAGYRARREGFAAEARSFYSEAAALLRDGQPLRAAHALRHAGDILRESGAFADARPYYDEALTIYRGHEASPVLDLANALRGFALLLEEVGQKQQA